MFTITKAWLEDNATATVGWSARQLAIIGTRWPPRKGWKRRQVGHEITDSQKADFERVGEERRREIAREVLAACVYAELGVDRERPF